MRITLDIMVFEVNLLTNVHRRDKETERRKQEIKIKSKRLADESVCKDKH